MTFKRSHIALAFVASASFSAVAETVVTSSEIRAQALVIIAQHTPLSLTINPVANLTVSEIKKGKTTTVAKFKVDGSQGNDAAVRLRASESSNPMCADLLGASDKKNKMQVCLGSTSGVVVDDGVTYYKYGNGEFGVVSGSANAIPTSTVVADTYNMSMELVRYTK